MISVKQFRRLVRTYIDRFAAWYWGDQLKALRHAVEEDARRLNGRVVWEDMQ